MHLYIIFYSICPNFIINIFDGSYALMWKLTI